MLRNVAYGYATARRKRATVLLAVRYQGHFETEIPADRLTARGEVGHASRWHEFLSHPSKSHKPLSLNKIADLPPPEWLIGELVPQDGLAVLYGEPAAGASFVTLDWGLSVATGEPWLGHEMKQGEVVYIYAEGVRGPKRRAEILLHG